jgi:hypothetical protein
METLNPQWSEYLLGKVQSMPKLTNQQLGRFLDGLLVRFQKELRGMNQAPIQETIVKALRKQNNPLGDMFQEAAENGLAGTTTGGPFYRHPDGLQRPGRVMDQHGIEAGIVMGSLWDTWRGNYDELEQAAIASTVSWQAPKRIKSVKRTNKAERGENHGSQRR